MGLLALPCEECASTSWARLMRMPGFIGGSYVAQSLTLDAEDTINLYVEQARVQSAQNTAALLPVPGFQQWAHVTDVVSRGFTFANGRLFGVIGAGFYEFDINRTATKRGTVILDANPAQFAYNGLVGGQLGICAGGAVSTFTLATNVFAAAPVVTTGITHLAYAGGFGVAFQATTGRVFLSTLNDLSAWSAGQFFQRSLFADPWQAMWTDANNLIWLPGTDSFEVWNNTGVGTQPFAPLSGLVGLYGIAAPFAYTRTSLGNGWLARTPDGIGQFVFTQGASPKSVNTYAVDTAIDGYLSTSVITDAEVMTYNQGGHTFSNVAFPSAGMTWTYDVEAQGWAKRARWSNGAWSAWAPRCHVQAFGKHLVGDRSTGSVWEMATTFATDIDGLGIRRLRRAPHVTGEHKRIPIDQFELLMDVGLGLATGQGSNPLVMLRVSSDGGRTFGNERIGSVGKIGEFRKRVYWTNLGAPSDAVFEVTYAEPTPCRIVDAFLNNQERAA